MSTSGMSAFVGPAATAGEKSHLIELSTAGSGLSKELLKAEGGFLWWYADMVDARGNGLVLIWSYGLPFLPGYASAARRGVAPAAGKRPSLNVSTYKEGTLDFYLLQEFDVEDVHWEAREDGDVWRFGRSRLSSLLVGEERELKVDLDLDVPGMEAKHVSLTLEARGPALVANPGEHRPGERQCDPVPAHDWTPILCATTGSAKVEVPGHRMELEGRLYHDRNGGYRALHDLGIDIWVWGRVAMEDRDFVYYVLDGQDDSQEALFLEVLAAGKLQKVEDAELRRGAMKKNLGGLRHWPEMEIVRGGEPFLKLQHRKVVDSGPFYMRTVFDAEDTAGGVHRGIAEICDPERVDLGIHRPLVKMRVHHQKRWNSMFLPLFTGPKEGRVERLVRSWMRAPMTLMSPGGNR